LAFCERRILILAEVDREVVFFVEVVVQTTKVGEQIVLALEVSDWVDGREQPLVGREERVAGLRALCAPAFCGRALLFGADYHADVVVATQRAVKVQDVLPVPTLVSEHAVGRQGIGAEAVAMPCILERLAFYVHVVNTVLSFYVQPFEEFQLTIDRSLKLVGI